jgi:hypothetical protein
MTSIRFGEETPTDQPLLTTLSYSERESGSVFVCLLPARVICGFANRCEQARPNLVGEGAELTLLIVSRGSPGGLVAVRGDMSGHPTQSELDHWTRPGEGLISKGVVRRNGIALQRCGLRRAHRHSPAREVGEFDHHPVDRVSVER